MVSVFLLSWNHEKYIRQALHSILAQTYTDIEVIYVDNNSEDHSYQVASEILERSGIRFATFKRDKNYGIAANHNFAVSKCSGEYLCALSADDWLHKDNIEEKVRVYEQQPDIGLVYSGGYKYYEDLKVYEPFHVITFPDQEALPELLQRNFISAVGSVIRMKVIAAVGGWNESYLIEDGDMWVRIVSKYRIIGINKYLFFYRQHSNGFSQDPEKMLRAKMEWLEANKHLNKHPEITLRNNIDNYLSKKVMQETSFSIIGKVVKHFRFNKLYFTMIIKSILPVSFKKTLYKRSLLRKFKNVVPEQ